MRIVVVGAGVVGLACAYELLHDGHHVVVLDAARAGSGASHGNAAKVALAEAGPVPAPGMVVQGLKWMLRSDSPLYVRPSLSPPFVRFMLQLARNCTEDRFRSGLALNLELAVAADAMFDEWRDAGLHFELHQRGVLLAYQDAEQFRSRLRYADVFDRFGVAGEVLDADGVHRREPALSDRIEHGLFYPGDRQIEPDSLIAALVEHIGKRGGVVGEDSGAVGFERSGTTVSAVRTTTGMHACDALVLAAGVHSTPIAAELGVPLPIQPGKGYSLDYTPPPVQLQTSLTLEDAHVAITPLDGLIRVAGTMEFSGMDTRLNRARLAAVSRAAADGLTGWDADAPRLTPWAGLRPMTPDGLPLIGRLSSDSNVLVATGHGMLGLTQAPVTGRAVRDLLRPGAVEDLRFSPRRFAGRTR